MILQKITYQMVKEGYLYNNKYREFFEIAETIDHSFRSHQRFKHLSWEFDQLFFNIFVPFLHFFRVFYYFELSCFYLVQLFLFFPLFSFLFIFLSLCNFLLFKFLYLCFHFIFFFFYFCFLFPR
jgi:hypothetical protein